MLRYKRHVDDKRSNIRRRSRKKPTSGLDIVCVLRGEAFVQNLNCVSKEEDLIEACDVAIALVDVLLICKFVPRAGLGNLRFDPGSLQFRIHIAGNG